MENDYSIFYILESNLILCIHSINSTKWEYIINAYNIIINRISQNHLDKFYKLKLINCRKILCEFVNIETLPYIPNIVEISCIYCNLQYLEDIYPNCKIFIVDENKLKKIPYLPKCEILYCSANQLKCLPVIPDCMKKIWCKNNPELVYNEIIAKKFNLEYPPSKKYII
tara:strand:- start:844 stop:1350 length:507 start_codon:yes stop_codon:yes gene_type:complete